jgi:Zn ribbon nucleic-acid-binding protein
MTREEATGPMTPNVPAPLGPPCPACQSVKTIQTYDHLDETMYCCPACGYSWMLIQSRYVTVKKKVPPEA